MNKLVLTLIASSLLVGCDSSDSDTSPIGHCSASTEWYHSGNGESFSIKNNDCNDVTGLRADNNIVSWVDYAEDKHVVFDTKNGYPEVRYYATQYNPTYYYIKFTSEGADKMNAAKRVIGTYPSDSKEYLKYLNVLHDSSDDAIEVMYSVLPLYAPDFLNDNPR